MSTYHGILLHVVFSTKYRKSVLADAWRDDLFAYIGGTVKDHQASLLKASGIEVALRLWYTAHKSWDWRPRLSPTVPPALSHTYRASGTITQIAKLQD